MYTDETLPSNWKVETIYELLNEDDIADVLAIRKRDPDFVLRKYYRTIEEISEISEIAKPDTIVLVYKRALAAVNNATGQTYLLENKVKLWWIDKKEKVSPRDTTIRGLCQ